MSYKQITLMIWFLFSSVFAGTIDPNTDDNKYIIHGRNFDCVLQIQGYDSEHRINMGSCVLINEEWILTAAHVVYSLNDCKVISSKDQISVEKIFIPKEFKIHRFGIGDIALGKLSKKINIDKYPELYLEKNELNKICDIVGFGITGTFLTGHKISDGKKRAGKNRIEDIRDELLVCSPSKDKDILPLEFLISHGDSGGGLFIDSRLAGINSCVMADDKNPNSSYNDEGCHTRVSQYIGWIREIVDNYEK